MSKRIFRAIMITVGIVLLAALLITNGYIYDFYSKTQISRLKEELALAGTGVENMGTDYFENFKSSVFRFTFISPDGKVLYDSEVNADSMDNHIDREEIKEALENGSGSSARYSATLTERTYYEAERLTDGSVLRISTTQVTFATLLLGMSPAIAAIILLSVIISTVLSGKMAKSIVKPLEELNLDAPAENETYEELTPVLTKLNRQHKKIIEQMHELEMRSDELRRISASMNEGLVMLDKHGKILSINPAAEKLFGAEDDVIGRDFYVLDRSRAMSRATELALGGTHSEFRENRGEREYQFMITPTVCENCVTGLVMLCIDVTESASAERIRREFTANVSHELKTPLQSIVGCAELLESGLVKAEDTDRFIGNIKKEAERLVALINDIIRLSRLDEAGELPTEEVDLCALSKDVISALEDAAEKKNVTLSLSGESCVINGVRSYLYEIIYNLCDNAIRYNKDGGKVEIYVSENEKITTLRVSDTGIGIPAEHRDRIFERFYRVDKSHSKQTGGTGLGLSIVKHAVACHGGQISLESTVDVGTSITVTFHKN